MLFKGSLKTHVNRKMFDPPPPMSHFVTFYSDPLPPCLIHLEVIEAEEKFFAYLAA